MNLPDFILLLAGTWFVLSALYCFVWPHPKKHEKDNSLRKEIHDRRIEHFQQRIETANKGHTTGTKIYGIGEDTWRSAQREEEKLKQELQDEIDNYKLNSGSYVSFCIKCFRWHLVFVVTLLGLAVASYQLPS